MKNVVFIGSGNVATCIAQALIQKGFKVDCVYSRNILNAQKLTHLVGGKATANIGEISIDADLYIIAITDDAIESISNQIKVNGLVVHTSGCTPLNVLSNNKRFGVFYALQTFTKNTAINLMHVPFLIEANNNNDEVLLINLAKLLSENVQVATTPQRQNLHVAAVFANNFSNHMFAIAKLLLEEHHLSFDLLKPLILQTAKNSVELNPLQVQTGPAIRRDGLTLSTHIEVLHRNPEFRQIYEILSQSIRQVHTKKD